MVGEHLTRGIKNLFIGWFLKFEQCQLRRDRYIKWGNMNVGNMCKYNLLDFIENPKFEEFEKCSMPFAFIRIRLGLIYMTVKSAT